MESLLQVEYSYRMKGHFAVDEVDTGFYKTLVGVQERYIDPETGQPTLPLPSIDQVLNVIGTTLLSSESVAGSVKAWLDTHETRITISVLYSDHRIEFEGPNLEKGEESIKEMIDKMVAEENRIQITIYATHVAPEPSITLGVGAN